MAPGRTTQGLGSAAGTPLHRPGALLGWHEADRQRYVGGDYEIALVEPRKWEVSHRGEHVAFDASREWSFRIAEDHHRERLRMRDLAYFGAIAAVSAVVLFAMVIDPQRAPVWILAVVGLWIIHASALLSLLYTLARIGRLRGGARYAVPFGRATHLAQDRQHHPEWHQPLISSGDDRS